MLRAGSPALSATHTYTCFFVGFFLPKRAPYPCCAGTGLAQEGTRLLVFSMFVYSIEFFTWNMSVTRIDLNILFSLY